jgi:hypothetical protein
VRAAGFDMKIHPHMLRHSCGYKLANDGVDTRTIQSYLGHEPSKACARTPVFVIFYPLNGAIRSIWWSGVPIFEYCFEFYCARHFLFSAHPF